MRRDDQDVEHGTGWLRVKIRLSVLGKSARLRARNWIANSGGEALFGRCFYLICRVITLAATLLPLVSAVGCALFREETWDMNRYRDERAVDIDHRLERSEPVVKNPF
jgi:hypothetical protein